LLPSGMFFFGLKVFEDRLPNRKLMSLQVKVISIDDSQLQNPRM